MEGVVKELAENNHFLERSASNCLLVLVGSSEPAQKLEQNRLIRVLIQFLIRFWSIIEDQVLTWRLVLVVLQVWDSDSGWRPERLTGPDWTRTDRTGPRRRLHILCKYCRTLTGRWAIRTSCCSPDRIRTPAGSHWFLSARTRFRWWFWEALMDPGFPAGRSGSGGSGIIGMVLVNV